MDDEFENESLAVARKFRLRATELRTEAKWESGERRNSKMALAQEYERRADVLDPVDPPPRGEPPAAGAQGVDFRAAPVPGNDDDPA